MKKVIMITIASLLLIGCNRVYETNSGAYFVKWNSLYKVEDKTMFSVRDLSNDSFVPGEILDSEIKINNAINVNVDIKVLSSTILYKMFIQPVNGPDSDDMEYLRDLVIPYNGNNSFTIQTRDPDGFLLNAIIIELDDSPVGSQDEEGQLIGYSYEGISPISSEVAQSISYISHQWKLSEP